MPSLNSWLLSLKTNNFWHVWSKQWNIVPEITIHKAGVVLFLRPTLWCFSCGSCCCENCINQALSVSETNFKVLPQWFGRCLVETPGIECVVTCDPFLHCNYGTEWIWCTGKLTRASHKPWGGSHEPNIIIEKSNFASIQSCCVW